MRKATGVALLTIRAWCEEGAEQPLRLEIRLADDVASGFGSTVTLTHVGAVLEAVREFLDGLPCPAPEDVTPVSRPGHG
jgi:hypothetical protein